MLPLIPKLWAGDVQHNGEFWQFPTATSCPKPVQDSVPIWVAARSPTTFDHAVENNCYIMSWHLTMSFSEAEKYRGQLEDSITRLNSGDSGKCAMMRHAVIYETESDRPAALDAVRQVLARFGNLMMQLIKKGLVIFFIKEF